MTAPGAHAPRTRASHGVVRWTRAAVIALLAALAVLIHHESAGVATEPASAPAAHVMTYGMPMSGGHAAPVRATTISAEGAACEGMAMQHCSAASLDVVKLLPPARSPAPQDSAAHEAVTAGTKAAGTVCRAPPDLSVLSQLRI